MSYYNVIGRGAMVNGQFEDISIPLANYDAIAAVINALGDMNIAPNAGIKLSKLEPNGVIGGITLDQGNLRVPGYIWSGGDVTAWKNNVPVVIGHVGPALEPAISFAGDTNIYRTGVGILQTTTLHAANLQERSEKGQPNGYAPLDSSGHVPVAFVPDISTTYQVRSEKGIASGYAPLDASNLVPLAHMNFSTVQVKVEKGQLGGYASLDGSGKVPTSQLPPAPDLSPYQLKSEKAQPSGYASLDATGKVPAAQLPPSVPGVPVGGTTGQVLTKQSATNYDTYWTTVAGGGGALPADTVLDAVTRIISNKVLAGDAQPTWRVLGSGRQEWGPGGINALDTFMYRGGAGVVQVDGTFAANNPTANLFGFSTKVSTDAQWRWGVEASGKMWFGSGAATQDVNLYRASANKLKTDGAMDFGGVLYSAQQIYAAGEIKSMYGLAQQIDLGNDGKIYWGSAYDTNLYRSAAGVLKTDGVFNAVGGLQINGVPVGGASLPADTVVVAGTRIISNKLLAGDAQPAWRVFGDGKQEWGPGGATAPDTNLYRWGAGNLKTDGALYVSSNFYANAGLPTQIATDTNGFLWFGTPYDTKLYRYAAGVLKTDGRIHALDDILVRPGSATLQAALGSVGANGGIHFGSAEDANLYRSAAGVLKTDGILNAVGGLQINGVPVGGASADGWAAQAGAFAYVSADGPTFVMSSSVDLTAQVALGARVRLTQSATVKYFLVTAITATQITLFGGTDYVLANVAISAVSFSAHKAPVGFPLDPAKWTVKNTQTSSAAQSSPGGGTWYNLGGSLSIPIGAWQVYYQVTAQTGWSSGPSPDAISTLSTANNTENDKAWSRYWRGDAVGGTNVATIPFTSEGQITLAAKATYFLNLQTTSPGCTGITSQAGFGYAIIRAVSAYL
jgi:hypothetical protein